MKKSLAPRSFSEVGFTLLEMLVVIGIIAILVSLGFASYSTVQKKARDAKRQGDLKAFQNCQEQYYSYNNNFKYVVVSNDTDIQTSDSFNCGGTTTVSIQDPLDNTTHKYVLTDTDTDGSAYKVCVTLETSTVPFCVTNQQ